MAAAAAVVESVVVVHNVAKRHNVGTLARSATAFGVAEVVVVGRRDVSAFGSHGSTSHLRFRHFTSLDTARAYLKDERGCDICGVEITDDALPVTAHPFRRSTAFLFGNEGTGLSQKECEICDFFIYIPQYGGGTASLNVTVAASIVLHHFGVWAGFPERGREGNKFVVADKPQGQSRGLYCLDSIEDVIEERKARRENACDIFEENGTSHPQESNGLGMMFTDEHSISPLFPRHAPLDKANTQLRECNISQWVVVVVAANTHILHPQQSWQGKEQIFKTPKF